MIKENHISKDDKLFLDRFLENELTEEGLKELNHRLKSPSFKDYYERRLKEKYSRPIKHSLVKYLPMLVLILLTLIGSYLIFTKYL